MATLPEVLTFRFEDAGNIPNHPYLPVLVYKAALAPADGRDLGQLFEETWPRHQWRPAWRWGVYDFPHYHSTTHEALGVYRGHATLRLGDRVGVTLYVQAGDLVVLPVGTGHENLGASPDFHVVGGYPQGHSADLLRGKPGERPAADERMAKVPLPTADPLFGADGPLMKHWRAAAKTRT